MDKIENIINELMQRNGFKISFMIKKCKGHGMNMNYHKLYLLRKNKQQPTLLEANGFCIILGCQKITKD